MIDIQLSRKKLNLNRCVNWALSDGSGCVNIFVGRVRPETKGRGVKYLDFEVYENMATLELQKIAKTARQRWKIDKILIHHRVGQVAVGQIPVIIVVSAPQRKAAFQACQYIIDTLKATVPIWKKEGYSDGEEWVFAHP